jgi:hypothetical protein
MPVIGTGIVPDDLAAITRRAWVPQLATSIWPDYSGTFGEKKWPRTFGQRIERMERMIQWKREKIRQRVLMHVYVAAAIFFGAPVVIAVASWLWRFALDAIIG